MVSISATNKLYYWLDLNFEVTGHLKLTVWRTLYVTINEFARNEGDADLIVTTTKKLDKLANSNRRWLIRPEYEPTTFSLVNNRLKSELRIYITCLICESGVIFKTKSERVESDPAPGAFIFQRFSTRNENRALLWPLRAIAFSDGFA